MKFRPLHESDQKTAGGIIIPDTAQENQWKVKLLKLDLVQETKMAN